jgi:hypothetical protein
VAQRSSLRASDADREQIAERLRHAAAEGRLLAHELEQRLATALRARTYGELDAVVADLPGDRLSRRDQRRSTSLLRPALALAIAIPLAVVIVATVVFVLTSVLAVWLLWVALGWLWFGRRRRYHGARRVGVCAARRPQARPGYWL